MVLRLKARSKYGSVRTRVDGIAFASKAEAKRYGELKLLEKAGEIRNLMLQPWFVLMAPVYRNGVENINEGRFDGVTPIGRYTADFKYEQQVTRGVWRWVIEDVKSKATKTTAYAMRKRHVEAQYDIEIVEVGSASSKTRSKPKSWRQTSAKGAHA